MSTSNLTPKTQSTVARVQKKNLKKEKNRKKEEIYNQIVSEFGKEEVGDMIYTDASLSDWKNLYDDLKDGTEKRSNEPPPPPPPPKRGPTPKKARNPKPAEYVHNAEFEEYLDKYRKLSGGVPPPIKIGDGPAMKEWYEKHKEHLEAQRLEIEKEKASNPAIQAVMVSVDSVVALRQAYPTYYLDTAGFLGIVDGFMKGASKNEETEGTANV